MNDRWTNTRARGQMRDGFEFLPVKEIPQGDAVAKIDLMNCDISRDAGHILALNPRIVKVIEIVENGDVVASGE